jgi:hypothetical protein
MSILTPLYSLEMAFALYVTDKDALGELQCKKDRHVQSRTPLITILRGTSQGKWSRPVKLDSAEAAAEHCIEQQRTRAATRS